MRRIDAESETLIVQDVAHALRADGFDASEDGTGRGTPLVAVPILEAGARTGKSTDDPRAGIGIGEDGDPMFTLQSGKQHAVAFTSKDYGADASDEISPTLRSMGHDKSHANGGGQIAVAFRACGQEGFTPSEIAPPITSTDGGGAGVPSVAFTERGRAQGRTLEAQEEVAYCVTNPGSGGRTHSRQIMTPQMAVRRLTVVECARLQGFPDTYLHEVSGKPRKIEADEAEYLIGHGIECWQDGEQWWTRCPADGPMYKALGNSMAVPVMRWILERAAQVLEAK